MRLQMAAVGGVVFALGFGSAVADKKQELWSLMTNDAPIQFKSGSVRVDDDTAETSVVVVNGKDKAIAVIEIEWEGYGAFEDRLETRTTDLNFRKPLNPLKEKTSKEDWTQLPPNITHYFVTVKRVRFADGSVWTAEVPSEEDKKRRVGWRLLPYQGFLSRNF